MGFKVYEASNLKTWPSTPKNCPGSALRQRPRVRAEHPASPVQRPRCGLGRQPQAALAARPATRTDCQPPVACPGLWDEIGPGHLVIAQESLEYGWWEAIVLDRKDNVFTLRYRDFPSLPKFFRDRFGIALMYPQAADASGPSRGWDELRPGHLVIAHESPADGWWEAIVLERKDDTFTLQYRDYPHLPKFVRHPAALR